MSMIGNTPGVSSQRTVLETVVSGSPRTNFIPQGGYVVGYVDVLVNGSELDSSDFTAADGININLAVAAAVGDTVKVKAWLPRGLSDGYLKSEADARFLKLDGSNYLTGNLGVGVTPYGWTYGKAIDLNNSGLFGYSNAGTTGLTLAYNQYYDGTAWRAKQAGASAILQLNTANFRVFGSDSVAANGAVTLTQLLFAQKDYTMALQGAASTPGTGVAFPATQVASADANTLDDYEEGSWTPFYMGLGSNPACTYGIAIGRYVKIGSVVTVHGSLMTTANSGGSGGLAIGGLPFTASSATDQQGVALALTAYWANPPVGGRVLNGSTRIDLAKSINNVDMTTADLATGSGTAINYIRFSATYIANQ